MLEYWSGLFNPWDSDDDFHARFRELASRSQELKFNGIVINYVRDGADGWRPVVQLSLRSDVPADIKEAICEHGQSLANDIIRWYRSPTSDPTSEAGSDSHPPVDPR